MSWSEVQIVLDNHLKPSETINAETKSAFTFEDALALVGANQCELVTA